MLTAAKGHADRIVFVGDQRQHHAIEAGVPVRQLLADQMAVVELTTIRRQRDPELCAKTIAKGSNSVQVNYGGYPFAAHYLCFFSRVNGAGSGEQAPIGR